MINVKQPTRVGRKFAFICIKGYHIMKFKRLSITYCSTAHELENKMQTLLTKNRNFISFLKLMLLSQNLRLLMAASLLRQPPRFGICPSRRKQKHFPQRTKNATKLPQLFTHENSNTAFRRNRKTYLIQPKRKAG